MVRHFPELFSPYRLKTIELRNRFVVPSMQRWRCRDGRPTSAVAAYYGARAAGGFAIVNSEAVAIDHPSACGKASALRLIPDTRDAWRTCVDAVTRQGAHMLMQLWHQGAMRVVDEGDALPSVLREAPTLSPSGLVLGERAAGRSATVRELADIRDAYVRSALIAQEIGAAGVEVHGGHGFLLDQFLWAATNLRVDEYGGADIAARARFPVEVVQAIRQAVGPDFIISFRFSQWKELDYSARIVASPGELERMLQVLLAAGVDMFNVSTRRFYKPEWPDSDMGLAGWTKRLSGAPVVAVGGVGVSNDVLEAMKGGAPTRNDVEASLRALVIRFRQGEFDLVAVGRASLADGDWVSKVADGRFDEIREFDRAALFADMGWDSGTD